MGLEIAYMCTKLDHSIASAVPEVWLVPTKM